MTTIEKEKNPTEEIEAEQEAGDMLPPRQQGYGLLRVMGVPQVQAARMCGYGRGMSSYLEKKLQKKYDLTSKRFVKLAAVALERILRGETWGKIEKIKDSTVVTAIQTVYDRAQPKQEATMDEEKITFININLDSYRSPSPEELKKLPEASEEKKGDNSIEKREKATENE